MDGVSQEPIITVLSPFCFPDVGRQLNYVMTSVKKILDLGSLGVFGNPDQNGGTK